MSDPQYGTLQAPQQTKFTDVKPGSTISIETLNGSLPTFEAMALEVKEEWGGKGLPAILYKTDGDNEPQLILDDGSMKIRILTDSSTMASSVPPGNLLNLLPKQKEVQAVQFVGGMESAAEIIRWAAGAAAIHYQQADSHHTEAVVITSLGGESVAELGAYIVKEDGGYTVVSRDAIQAKYDIV